MKSDTFDFKPFHTSPHQFHKIYLHFHNKNLQGNIVQVTLNLSLLFPISSLKSISTITTKKSLMELDTFDFKTRFHSSCYTYTLSTILSFSSIAFK